MVEILNELFLEIGGGGVKFAVVKDVHNRPVIEVEATHYGQTTNGMRLLTNRDALAKLGEMFSNAAKDDFSNDEYVYAAKPYEPSLTGNCESCGQEEN